MIDGDFGFHWGFQQSPGGWAQKEHAHGGSVQNFAWKFILIKKRFNNQCFKPKFFFFLELKNTALYSKAQQSDGCLIVFVYLAFYVFITIDIARMVLNI